MGTTARYCLSQKLNGACLPFRNSFPLARGHVALVVRAPPCSLQLGSASSGVWRGASSQGTGLPLHGQEEEAAGSEREICASAGAERQAQLTGDAHRGALVSPQQGKAEPRLSSALTRAGVRGDRATD